MDTILYSLAGVATIVATALLITFFDELQGKYKRWITKIKKVEKRFVVSPHKIAQAGRVL